MFRDGFALRGIGGSILWGSNSIPAARLTTWRIVREKDPDGRPAWALAAALAPVGGVDAFKLRQTPLYFTASRIKGFWMFRVHSVHVGTREIRARLGPPEQ
jgi:hypothetical protein